jgi:molecular chaperone GrpE
MSDYDPAQGPVIRDKRRIDPLTGEVRQAPYEQGAEVDPGASPSPAQEPGDAGAPYDDSRYAEPGEGDYGYAGPSAAYTQQATTAYAQQAAAYAEQVDPAWSYEEAPQGGTEAGPGVEPSGDAAAVSQELSERTADLQRLQAEYTNYRRRVDRDREAVKEQALVNVLTNLLPLLDDVARARDHGDLTGGFKSVGEALEATVEKLGLARFGEPGEPFDPMVHEALTHSYSGDVLEPTAVAVLQPGYRLGERVLRPARVAVAEPE